MNDKPENKSQLDKFKDAARESGADDDEKRFDERLRRVAKSPHPAERTEDVKRHNGKGNGEQGG